MWTFDSSDIPWEIDSSSEKGVVHQVRRRPAGGADGWTCTCKGYHYGAKKHLNYSCRHIKQVWKELISTFEQEMKGF